MALDAQSRPDLDPNLGGDRQCLMPPKSGPRSDLPWVEGPQMGGQHAKSRGMEAVWAWEMTQNGPNPSRLKQGFGLLWPIMPHTVPYASEGSQHVSNT